MAKNPRNRNILYSLDIFGIPIPLRFKQQSEYQTKCGVFSSLILILAFLILVLIFGIQLIERSNFTIISSLETNVTSAVDLSEVPIMFAMQTPQGAMIEDDPRLFSYSALKINMEVTMDNGADKIESKVAPLQLEQCDINKHFYGYESYFSHLNVSQYKCFKPGQNLQISGRIGDRLNGFKQITIYINQCNSSMFHCYSDTEAGAKLSNVFFMFTYLSNNVDHFNYTDPIQKEVRTETLSISSTLFKKYYYRFSRSEYHSDNGLIFEKIKKYIFFEYQGYNVDVNSDGQNIAEGSYSFTTFHCHDYVSKYKRICTKIQAMIATISGIFNVIFVVLKIITFFISSQILQVDMANTLIFGERKDKELRDIYAIQNSSSFNIKNSINVPMNTPISTEQMMSNNYFKSRPSTLTKGGEVTTTQGNAYLDTSSNSPPIRKKSPYLIVDWYQYILPFSCYKKEDFNKLRRFTDIIYYFLSVEQILPSIEKNTDTGGRNIFAVKEHLFLKNKRLKSKAKMDTDY